MNSERIKKTVSYIIPPLFTVGLCYALYADVDIGRIADGLRSCNWLLVALFLGCNLLAMVFRGIRWRLQLRAIGVDPPLGVMSRSIFGTYAVNIVFPRLGELWRSGFIARVGGAPFSRVFGTMVADRLSDTITVLLICIPAFTLTSGALNSFLAASGSGMSIGSLLTSWPVIALAVIAVIAAIYVAFGHGAAASRVRKFIVDTWRGFTAIISMPRKGIWLLLTLGVWGSYVLSMWLSMLAFPATAQILATHGFGAALLTFVFGSLAMAIPSNGGIGPWQLAIILSLSGLYGMDRGEALTFATINLAATTLLTIALGLYAFAHIALRKS